VRIGKNNVDSQGHTFGSHESYWVEDPLSWAARVVLLPLWIVCWALTLPALAWLVGVALAMATAGLMLLLVPTLVASLVSAAASLIRSPHWKDRGARLALRLSRVPVRVAERLHRDPGALPRQLAWIELPLRPAIALHSALYNRFHFRRIHRYLTAFLVTRTLFTGGGAVALDGGPLARLAQRPPHMRAFARIFTSGDDRPLYESRDVFFRPWSALGSRRRLHLMLGDANLCDHALALRVGVTALVLEAIESGEERWPVLPRPLAALRALNQDPDLVRRHCLADGTQATALDVQRRYLQGVKRFLSSRGDRADRHEKDWRERILSIWEETLDLLEREPDALADRVDWIAKRALLRREIPEPEDRRALERRGGALVANPPPDDPEARRLRDLAFRALRVDLRYHELSARGGHRRLERRSRIQRLVSDAAVERALRQPPEDTRACGRGGAIREACLANRSGGATWHRVRIGRRHWRFYADPLAPAATHTFG
jgi:proteasome accessory factor A